MTFKTINTKLINITWTFFLAGIFFMLLTDWNIIENIGEAEFERANLKSLGDFSIIYEIVYSLNTSDYKEYMNIQEQILLNMIETFEKEGIGFPYPTQKILYEKA